jgi:cellulose biosynthesis protein BcsQ
MEENRCQILSIVSSKGGAGKTSVSIGLAHLLNDIGLKVLLVDFDLNTNGSSYFFKYYFQDIKEKEGICERLDLLNEDTFFNLFDDNQVEEGRNIIKKNNRFEERLKNNLKEVNLKKLEVKENLFFIPSRIHFRKSDEYSFSEYSNYGILNQIVSSIIDNNKGLFDVIIFDNQAGSNLSSSVSSKHSNKVVIVSELDPISSDASENLLIQIGDSFPSYRRHLINKLYIKETNEYKQLNTLFQSFNRLPPLPFDFDVRNAFANRQIPIDINNPTSFLIALFNTSKMLFPEFKLEFDKYEEKINNYYSQYQKKIDDLLERANNLKGIVASDYKIIGKYQKTFKILNEIFVPIISGILVLIIFSTLIEKNIFMSLYKLFSFNMYYFVISVFVISLTIAFFIVSFKNILKKYQLKYSDNDKESIKKEIDNIDKEVSNYQSLMMTKSKDFLMQFDVQNKKESKV